ncbi:hypothetical protein LZP85_06895 [Priestia flexa]|uniref:hypothetical protein n=1 Tax=Priestia TaxID=2800373 RepID=UPI001F2E52DA|nr:MULTISPECIES: hypothetical protein [Priestia]MDN3362210.1 hypothetical protein [Priestia megaterium]MDT0149531.1 hypothetical protein [Priestia aryabhattai]MDT0154819.1 hypothetical protein [Priestia aryabhattai]UIR31505.1 hypothetical protein LZP85_06895 [Priestia flexa]
MIKYVEVNNDFIWNIEEYCYKEQFITVLLRTLSINPMGSARIGVNSLLQMLSLSDDKKNKASLKETLVEMEKKGMIFIFKDFSKINQIQAGDMKYANDYFIEVSHVSHAKTIFGKNDEGKAKNNFTKISFDVMMKLVAMNERNKSIAFSVYFNIVHWIWEGVSNWRVSNPTIKKLVEATGLDKKTITKYVKVLMEYELIYFETIREEYDKEKNYYCKWEDKDSFKEHVKALQNYYKEKGGK